MAHWKPKAANTSRRSFPILTHADRAALSLLMLLSLAFVLWWGSPSAPAIQPLPDYQVWVNVNTASFEQLNALPGIGPVLAQRIIERREAVGSFQLLEELLEIQGIGPVSIERLRPWVTFDQEF